MFSGTVWEAARRRSHKSRLPRSERVRIRTGAPPGTRTPNPRIKSGLLGRTSRSTCTNRSEICPERTQHTGMRPVLVPRAVPRHPLPDAPSFVTKRSRESHGGHHSQAVRTRADPPFWAALVRRFSAPVAAHNRQRSASHSVAQPCEFASLVSVVIGNHSVGGTAGMWSICCAGKCCGSDWANESSRRWPDRK